MLSRSKTVLSLIQNAEYLFYLAWKGLALVILYLVLWAFADDDALPPSGNYFHLFMIFLTAHALGKICFLVKLPPLVGMLVAGFAYGNIFDISLDKTVPTLLRNLALMVILLRAGLHLDPTAIRKLSFVVFRLAFLPSIVEVATITVAAHFFFNLPLAWGLLLGSILTAASPAITVPRMIKLQDRRLGTNKGIPTLIIAAASIDDVLAITSFSVCLGFALPGHGEHDSLAWSILKGPTEALVGVVLGIIAGILLWYLPERCFSTGPPGGGASSSKYHPHRFGLLLLMSVFALFGSQHFDFDGAGSLAIVVLSFTACLRWRPMGFTEFNERGLKISWILLEHFLFSLIGSEVRLKDLEPSVLLYGILLLLLAVGMRTLTGCAVIYGHKLSLKEKAFSGISWIPKATVQAAIGPVALDLALSNGDVDDITKGRLVLTVAVLSIILTAPLGAVAIDLSAKKLLTLEKTAGGGKVDENGNHQTNGHVNGAAYTIEEEKEETTHGRKSGVNGVFPYISA